VANADVVERSVGAGQEATSEERAETVRILPQTMNEELNVLTKLAPVPLLVVALNVLALGFKRVPALPNWLIPVVLPGIGALIYPFIGEMVPITGIDKLQYPWVFYGLIGLVCGGVAVWGHQLVTQILQRKVNGDTPTPTTTTTTITQ